MAEKKQKKKHRGDEENSCGRPWNTRKTVSPPFFFFPSTKYGLQCDRMTDKLFGNLFGSSSWLAVLLVVGSQRRQWWRRPQTLDKEEKRRPARKINLNRYVLICGILFSRIGGVLFFPVVLPTVPRAGFLSSFCFQWFICNCVKIDGRCPRGAQNRSIPEQSPPISAFLHWNHFFIPLEIQNIRWHGLLLFCRFTILSG